MGIPVVMACMAAWMLPMYLTHQKKFHIPSGEYWFAFLMGGCSALASLAVGMLLRSGPVSIPDRPHTLPGAMLELLYLLLLVAGLEECFKFLFGHLALKRTARRHPALTESGAMLVFGMAGLAFELTESIGALTLGVGLYRGLTPLHLFTQLFMGRYWFRARQASLAGDRKARAGNLCVTFLVPILIHTVFDFMVGTYLAGFDPGGHLEEVMTIVSIPYMLAFCAVVIVMYGKQCKRDVAARSAADAAPMETVDLPSAETADAAPTGEALS